MLLTPTITLASDPCERETQMHNAANDVAKMAQFREEKESALREQKRTATELAACRERNPERAYVDETLPQASMPSQNNGS